jgi:hypothetical protein
MIHRKGEEASCFGTKQVILSGIFPSRKPLMDTNRH